MQKNDSKLSSLSWSWADLRLRDLPASPGVYKFFDGDQKLLYVGKAKSLRDRVASYRRPSSLRSSRKTKRLVKLIKRVEMTDCSTELEALILENKLLRELKPPFNVVNKRPELYRFVVVHRFLEQAEFRLTRELASDEFVWRKAYGAFKSRSLAQEAFVSLRRCLMFLQNVEARLPNAGARASKSPRFHLSFDQDSSFADWLDAFEDFLAGKSLRCLTLLKAFIEVRPELCRFRVFEIQEDIKILRQFYKKGPRQNYRLSQKFDLQSALISQHELDDYLTRYRYEI